MAVHGLYVLNACREAASGCHLVQGCGERHPTLIPVTGRRSWEAGQGPLTSIAVLWPPGCSPLLLRSLGSLPGTPSLLA